MSKTDFKPHAWGTSVKEVDIMHDIQRAAPKAGATLYRNNCGAVKTKWGGYIRFGVCNPGGSDLIGWTRTGRFLAVEVKTAKGKVTEEQQAFLDAVNKSGGLGVVCRSAAELFAALNLTA